MTTRTLLRGVLAFVLAGYGVFLVGCLLLRWFVGERRVVVALLNNNLHLLLFPALILLPLCLLLRLRRVALLYALPVGFFAWNFAPYFLPHTLPSLPPDTQQISILTYNLQAEEALLDPMAAVIREADTEIVALQEMSGAAARHFERSLADAYPYRVFYPEPAGGAYHGRGLLSRYPLIENHFWPVTYPIPVRLQRAVLDVNGTPVTLFNFHAPPTQPIYGGGNDPRPRAQQINDLLALAADADGALLLTGDFNTSDLDESYAAITARYRDAFREVGWGFGFTNPDWQHDNPRRGASWVPMYQRIDYVFYSAHFAAVEARVWSSSGGSDHRPLWVRLGLIG
ncbi:MAG: endonuclease/exonuclease/phosphatase family protein [Anaerolineae bacterium]|nr:endonuclease/exonuclease/phosphatase family protein [Anaerolineae bacterium]